MGSRPSAVETQHSPALGRTRRSFQRWCLKPDERVSGRVPWFRFSAENQGVRGARWGSQDVQLVGSCRVRPLYLAERPEAGPRARDSSVHGEAIIERE